MDALNAALSMYEQLLNRDFYITIAQNDDKRILHLVFKKANFPHLLGITKLFIVKDVKIIPFQKRSKSK